MLHFDKNMNIYLCLFMFNSMCIYNYIIESNKVCMHHKYN